MGAQVSFAANGKCLAELTPEEVANLVGGLGPEYEKFIDKIIAEGISGEQLLKCKDNDDEVDALFENVNITKASHMKRIQKLFQDTDLPSTPQGLARSPSFKADDSVSYGSEKAGGGSQVGTPPINVDYIGREETGGGSKLDTLKSLPSLPPLSSAPSIPWKDLQFEAYIGEGSFGEVVKAKYCTNNGLPKDVAVKVVYKYPVNTDKNLIKAIRGQKKQWIMKSI